MTLKRKKKKRNKKAKELVGLVGLKYEEKQKVPQYEMMRVRLFITILLLLLK